MRVTFVCSGNTCRSPMLMFMCKKHAKASQITIDFDSAGLHGDGEKMNQKTKDVLAANRVAYTEYKSKAFDQRIFDSSDVVYTVSDALKTRLEDIYGKGKIRSLTEFTGSDVLDPYAMSLEAYESVYECFEELLPKLFQSLTGKV